jgi:hypothetical protein
LTGGPEGGQARSRRPSLDAQRSTTSVCAGLCCPSVCRVTPPRLSGAFQGPASRGWLLSCLTVRYLGPWLAIRDSRHGFARFVPRRCPEPVGHLQGIKNAMPGPPRALVPSVVQGIVVPIAQGHGELVRHLETECAGLCEANMMGLSRPAAADQAGLFRHEGEVTLIAHALFLGESQLTRRLRGLAGRTSSASPVRSVRGSLRKIIRRGFSMRASASLRPSLLRSLRVLISSLRSEPIICIGLSSPGSARSNAAKLLSLASQKT